MSSTLIESQISLGGLPHIYVLYGSFSNCFRIDRHVKCQQPECEIPACERPRKRQRRADDGKTTERLCRACKYAVRACERSFGGLLAVLLQELQACFQQQQHHCLLYLANEVIKVFGKDSAFANYLATLITVLFGQTIKLLQNIRDFTSRLDLADDCFLLASRCMSYCAGLLVPSQIMGPLFQCAVASTTIQHRYRWTWCNCTVSINLDRLPEFISFTLSSIQPIIVSSILL